jgi:photosystem II stability/assembly factor-like uncharacterized protein
MLAPPLAALNTDLSWAMALAGAAFALEWITLHSPHDLIGDVRIAYGPGRRRTLFVISRHNLLRAPDEGPWRRVTTGLGTWKLSSLVVSPTFDEDGTAFVASFGGGVFRSLDGGLTWSPCNQGLGDPHIVLLGFSPTFKQDRTVFALGRRGAVYRTCDGGHCWTAVWGAESAGPPPARAQPIDYAEILLDPVRDAGEAWAACHQIDGATCIAFTGGAVVIGDSRGELFASDQGGADWRRLAQLPGRPRITCIEAPQGSSRSGRVFVGTNGAGVFRIDLADGRVERCASSRGLARVTAIGSYSSADGRDVLMACGWDAALFTSSDEGVRWTRQARGLTRHRQADEHRFGAPHFRPVAPVSPAGSGEAYLGGFDGLFHRADAEGRWEPVETLPLGIVLGLSMARDPKSNGVFMAVATYGAGVYVLAPGAARWQAQNQGLPTLRLGSIRHSPEWPIDRVMFVASEGAVLRWQEDEGRWSPVPLRPAGGAGRSSVGWFARMRGVERLVARRLSNRLVGRLKGVFQTGLLLLGRSMNRFVFPTTIAFSPRYSEDQTVFVGSRAHGVFRSQDGGRSYAQLWDGAGRFVFSIAPLTASTSRGVVFAGLSDGLYRSEDFGVSWTRIETESRFRAGRIAAASDGRGGDTVFVGTREGLLRSRDGGRSWHDLPLVAGERAVIIGLTLSPDFANDRTLLVQAAGDGLYRSRDGGDSFERLRWDGTAHDPALSPPLCFPDATTLFEFSPDFARDRTILAAGFDRIHLSRDAGASWTELHPPTRYENIRPEIRYEGRWTVDTNPAFGAQRAHGSSTPGDRVSLRFYGANVSWIGAVGPDHGMAEVCIDGQLKTTVDLYAAEPRRAVRLCRLALAPGRHEIAVKVCETSNPSASGRKVLVDAFEIDDEASASQLEVAVT